MWGQEHTLGNPMCVNLVVGVVGPYFQFINLQDTNFERLECCCKHAQHMSLPLATMNYLFRSSSALQNEATLPLPYWIPCKSIAPQFHSGGDGHLYHSIGFVVRGLQCVEQRSLPWTHHCPSDRTKPLHRVQKPCSCSFVWHEWSQQRRIQADVQHVSILFRDWQKYNHQYSCLTMAYNRNLVCDPKVLIQNDPLKLAIQDLNAQTWVLHLVLRWAEFVCHVSSDDELLWRIDKFHNKSLLDHISRQLQNLLTPSGPFQPSQNQQQIQPQLLFEGVKKFCG